MVPSATLKASLVLSPARIGITLAIVGMLVALVDAGFEVLGHRMNTENLWPISRQFDFSEEGNFANWYQSMTLLLCAGILAAIAMVTRKVGGKRRGHWIGLAFVFLFVSIDEAAQVHETTVAPLILHWRHHHGPTKAIAVVAPGKADPGVAPATAGTKAAPGGDEGSKANASEGADKLVWMIPYLAVFVALVLVYLRFFFGLAPRVRGFFVVAAVLYVGGAAGIERILGHISERQGDSALVSQLISTGSELMEMLGVAAFVYALLLHLSRLADGVEVRVGRPPAE